MNRASLYLLTSASVLASSTCARPRSSTPAPELRDCANELPRMRLDSATTPSTQLQTARRSGLYVRVRTARGEPIGQAQVNFITTTGRAVRDSTDATGVVELRLPPEAGEVTMRKIGFYRGVLKFIPRAEYVDTLTVHARCAVPTSIPVLTGPKR